MDYYYFNKPGETAVSLCKPDSGQVTNGTSFIKESISGGLHKVMVIIPAKCSTIGTNYGKDQEMLLQVYITKPEVPTQKEGSKQMSDIETELLKVTKHRRQGRDEDRGEYLTRLWDAAESLKDEDWKMLSEPAGNWVNDVTTAYRAYKKDKGSGEGFEPTDFSTVEKAFATKKEKEWAEQFARDKTAEAEAEAAEAEEEEREAQEDTENSDNPFYKGLPLEEPRKRRGRPPNVEVKGNGRSEPAVEPKEVVTERGFNLQSAVRKLMMKEPNMPLDKIHASIQEQVGAPVTLSTIQTSRASFRSALKELHAAGHLTGIDPEGLK